MPDKSRLLERRRAYIENLKDPRWDKVRLSVFERDDWACQLCFDAQSPLTIHHRYFQKDTEPWEYSLDALVTLCEECHRDEVEHRDNEEKSLLYTLRKNFFTSDLNSLVIGFGCMQPQHLPEVIASMIEWILQNPLAQRQVIDMYFNYLTRNKKSWHIDANERFLNKTNS